jgi:hypothetical protein
LQYESFLSIYGCLEKYLKKLVGRTDIEDALGRLDRLTQEEVLMTAAQGLEATHAVIDGAQIFSSIHSCCPDRFVRLGVERVREETQQVVNEMGSQKRSFFRSPTSLAIKV